MQFVAGMTQLFRKYLNGFLALMNQGKKGKSIPIDHQGFLSLDRPKLGQKVKTAP
jgi:hypothetical protein